MTEIHLLKVDTETQRQKKSQKRGRKKRTFLKQEGKKITEKKVLPRKKSSKTFSDAFFCHIEEEKQEKQSDVTDVARATFFPPFHILMHFSQERKNKKKGVKVD